MSTACLEELIRYQCHVKQETTSINNEYKFWGGKNGHGIFRNSHVMSLILDTNNYQNETNTTIFTQRNLPTGLIGLSSSLRLL